MNLKTIFENFRWAKFATPYETNAKELGQKFLSVLNGDASEKDYQFIENNLEHQSTFYKISPWGLKFYLALLDENNTDKALILKGIKVLFESANYKNQVDKIKDFKPTKKDLEKYETLKFKLFDDAFDGVLDDDFLKGLKLIKSNFWHIAILDYLALKKSVIKNLQTADNKAVKTLADELIFAMENPKIYEFG